MNHVILSGRICSDPNYNATTSSRVCKFRIAVNRRFKNQSTGQYDADFINCTAWNSTADFVHGYFHKGDGIVVSGELRNSDYTDKNGVKHYGMDVNVNTAEFPVGLKKTSESTQNAPQQPGQVYPTSNAPTTQTAYKTPQNAPTAFGNLDDFEDILSDGNPPF
jgi:single-strand DNA-binding protein